MAQQRIEGLDVARAIAVMGMIIVNFKMVFGADGPNWLQAISNVFDGKAAATFVVLAGMGISLVARSALMQEDQVKLRLVRRRLLKRSIFLFVVGLSYLTIWPADILHFYGIYMLVCLLLIDSPNKTLLLSATLSVLLFPVMLVIWDYESGWNFKTFEYQGFWEWEGFLRNLFYNGFHPLIPWVAFMIFGMWLGRHDLHNKVWVKSVMRWSAGVFILCQVTSGVLMFLLEGTVEDAQYLVGVSPMPPMPLYMLNGLSIAGFVISGSILLAWQMAGSQIIVVLRRIGELALTFYVAHVVIGMGLVEALTTKPLGTYSLAFSMVYALIFIAICGVFATWWRKNHKLGPVEWVMRRITG